MATVLFAAGFRVPPAKDQTEHDAAKLIEGSELSLKGRLATRVSDLIREAMPRPIDIRFPSEDQTHLVRDRIRAIAQKHKALDAAQRLALDLAMATDNRSKLGLLLIVVTTRGSGEDRTVHLWRFGSEQNLIAQFRGGHLDVEVLDEAFAAESIYFKAARFTGRPEAKGSFWTGQAEDRQAKLPGAAASAYWIEAFLRAELAVTPIQGTGVLAEAIQDVLRRTKDPQLQGQVVTGALGILNATGERVSFEAMVRRLPREIRDDVLHRIDRSRLPRSTQFVLEGDALRQALGIRELTLDTGVVVAGPNRTFDEVVRQREVGDDQIELRTVGALVRTRVKASPLAAPGPSRRAG